MPAVTNADLFIKLGAIEAHQSHAEKGRAVLHQKMDSLTVVQNETVKTLAELQFALRVTTDVAIQARDKMESLEPVVKESAAFTVDAAPVVKIMKQIKLALYVLAALLALMGVTGGVVLANANEIVKWAVLRWLGI